MTRTVAHRVLLPAQALLLLALAAGCGYKAGFLMPPEIRTVNVEVVANRTFWREAAKVDALQANAPAAARPGRPMAVDLTECIRREIVRRTPLRLADQGTADSVLTATIRSVELSVFNRDGQDNVVVAESEVVVDFTWKDLRTGRILAERDGLRRPTRFYARQGESFTTAAEGSFDYLAEQIVEAMQQRF